MRRAPAIALALILPAAAIIGGSANASAPAPTLSNTTAMGSMDMSSMDMSSMPMGSMPMGSMDMGSMPMGSTQFSARAKARFATENAARVAQGKLPVIHGVVGPGFTISVDPGSVPAGRYKFVVQDKSGMHNWHIKGPGGVDKATTVAGVDKVVWKIKLVKGIYTIVCDVHSMTMKTQLAVT